MRKLFQFLFLFLFTLNALAQQIADPVKWKTEYKALDKNTIELLLTATIDKGYHIYGTDFPDGGPIRTSLTFDKSDNFSIIGKIIELTKAKEKHDASFDMLITLHSQKAVFSQKIKLLKKEPFEIKGFVEYMACTDESCLTPVQKEFAINVKPAAEEIDTAKKGQVVQKISDTTVKDLVNQKKTSVETTTEIKPSPEAKPLERGILAFFILAFLAGLAGTITPCVFPMIPMTVSFFMRDSGSRGKAILKGATFGISIMLTYTLVGVLVSLTSVGAEFANQLSTHWFPNTLFFMLFIVFSASFFGMFEMVLPSSIVNKADQQADKGGYLGIIFMALATVLVSFSCTGPIVGALLVEAAGGIALKPILGMFGFGLAFALPFTFFAIFPSTMKSLPKSGGWLNSVKIVLGFIMLAFSLKFLVNIDQTYHWNLLSRELFLAIWIVLAILMGLYILGFIKFSHDSALSHISVGRLALSIISFVFAIYLATGLGNNPLTSISSLLPPTGERTYSNSDMSETKSNICETPKYAELLHFPYGLKGYFDYQQAIACAKQLNKPILIDFKGHACSNCKKMEAEVWSNAQVKKSLSEDFVLLGLYTDDRTELSKKEWITSSKDGKLKKTMGQINADFQISRFESNALPYYVIIDLDGNLLNEPIGTELDPEKYLYFLQTGKKAFELKKQ